MGYKKEWLLEVGQMWSCNTLVDTAAWKGRTRIPEDHIDWSWYPQTRGELPG